LHRKILHLLLLAVKCSVLMRKMLIMKILTQLFHLKQNQSKNNPRLRMLSSSKVRLRKKRVVIIFLMVLQTLKALKLLKKRE
jgi:hypothetical protein